MIQILGIYNMYIYIIDKMEKWFKLGLIKTFFSFNNNFNIKMRK